MNYYEFQLKRVKCLKTHGNSDTIKLVIGSDSDFAKDLMLLQFSNDTERDFSVLSNPILFENGLNLQLFDTGPGGGPAAFWINILKNPSIGNGIFDVNNGGYHYNIEYSISRGKVKIHERIINNQKKYVREEGGLCQLFHKKADAKKCDNPYQGDYIQADAKVGTKTIVNACGPVAVANLLTWYGLKKDVMWKWKELVDGMKTNNWDTWPLVIAELIVLPLSFMGSLISIFVNAGTLPKDLRNTVGLKSPLAGLRLEPKTSNGTLGQINGSLKNGHPVIVLYTSGSGNYPSLHWAVITGAYIENGVKYLRIANGNKLDENEFNKSWSLGRYNQETRDILSKTFIGIKPRTLLYCS